MNLKTKADILAVRARFIDKVVINANEYLEIYEFLEVRYVVQYFNQSPIYITNNGDEVWQLLKPYTD